MTFSEMQQRFAEHLRERIRSGEVTERALAHRSGISQPHLHNVLKGKRFLSAGRADQILRCLDLDLVDLITLDELLSWQRRR